jgi:hypothetical protein
LSITEAPADEVKQPLALLEKGVFVDADNPSSVDVIRTWLNLRDHLNDAQKKPMLKLLQMVGLWKVKQRALNIFREVIAEKELSQQGFKPRGLGGLNFAFLGNPGLQFFSL